MLKKHRLNHALRAADGSCAACNFLKTAIGLQRNPEYLDIFKRQLQEAEEMHRTQPQLDGTLQPGGAE